MTLDEYLDWKGEKLPEFAKRSGVNLSTLYRIRNGQHRRTQETIEKIVAATGGKVSADALIFAKKHRRARTRTKAA